MKSHVTVHRLSVAFSLAKSLDLQHRFLLFWGSFLLHLADFFWGFPLDDGSWQRSDLGVNDMLQNVLLSGHPTHLHLILKEAQVWIHWHMSNYDEGTNPQIRSFLKAVCTCLPQNKIFLDLHFLQIILGTSRNRECTWLWYGTLLFCISTCIFNKKKVSVGTALSVGVAADIYWSLLHLLQFKIIW